MKGESKSGYLMKAVLCGFLIAFNVVLFMNYFLDVNLLGGSFIWFIAIDGAFVFLIAYPFKEGGVIALTIFLLILGYAAYGPYSEHLRGPMSNIGESMSELPGTAEKQMHCLMLIFSNPMAYQQECVITDQEKATGEKPEDFGLEITNFELQPKGETYAGMPIQIWMTLENKGSYGATNVSIKTTGGKYDVCENLEVLNITGITGNYSDNIRKETDHYFSLTGSVNDPWTEECTYAKNKMLIGGTIKTTYSYDYQTESYLEIEAIKNINESKSKFKVNSAKEKAAPANTLMYTFVPLIWKGAGAGFKEGIIPISFKNERRGGKVTFRGKYVHKTAYLPEDYTKKDWCDYTCSRIDEPSCKKDCKKSYEETKSEYHHCGVIDSSGEEVDRLDLSEEKCKNTNIEAGTNEDGEYSNCLAHTEIEAENETDCGEKGGSWEEESCFEEHEIEDIASKEDCKNLEIKQIYKVRGKYEREHPDRIKIYIVGEDAKKYADLSCGKGEQDVVNCREFPPAYDKVELIWREGKLDLKPDDDELIYSGVKVSLTDWPDEDTLDLNFGIKADATYKVKMERSDNLQIKTPHYTD